MADDLLRHLPLEVLLALQEALADPTEAGVERARLRALDLGFHIECTARRVAAPIPMEEAPEGVESLHLRFAGDDGP